MLPRCPNKNEHHSENQCLFSATYTSDGAKHVCRSRFCARVTALHTTTIHSRASPAILKNYLYTQTGHSLSSGTISTINRRVRAYHQTNKAPQDAACLFFYFLFF